MEKQYHILFILLFLFKGLIIHAQQGLYATDRDQLHTENIEFPPPVQRLDSTTQVLKINILTPVVYWLDYQGYTDNVNAAVEYESSEIFPVSRLSFLAGFDVYREYRSLYNSTEFAWTRLRKYTFSVGGRLYLVTFSKNNLTGIFGGIKSEFGILNQQITPIHPALPYIFRNKIFLGPVFLAGANFQIASRLRLELNSELFQVSVPENPRRRWAGVVKLNVGYTW